MLNGRRSGGTRVMSLPSSRDPTRRWLFKSGNDTQQRRLAAAGRSKQRYELALPNPEADRLECDLVVELLADGVDPHERPLGVGRRGWLRRLTVV